MGPSDQTGTDLPAAMTSTSADGDINVVGLGKRYGESQVLHDVSFTLRKGEFLTLLGPSGSGKTTSLGIIAGFVQPDYGDVTLGSRSMLSLPPRKRNLGIVFQNYALFPHLTVAANVEFGLHMRGVQRPERRRRSERMLQRVGLGEFAHRKPSELSGGQQQRVALARALIIDPVALLLDEPLGALDRRLRQQVEIELKAIQRETGVSVLHVTHDQEEAMVMSDRLAVMRGGRIEQIDTPTEVYKHPRTRFVANFLGEANLFDARPGDRDGTRMRVTYADGSTGSVDLGRAHPSQQTGHAVICVRPERITFVQQHTPAENRISGTVVRCLHLGASIRWTVQAMGQEVTVETQDNGQLEPPLEGSRVHLAWGAGDAQLLAEDS